MVKISLLLVFSIALLFSCEKKDDDAKSDCLEIEFNTNTFVTGPFDENTRILEAGLEGDCLQLTLSYPGGCLDHQIGLAAQGWIKTYPVQINAKVIHDNQDLCEALITESFTFDLLSVRYGANSEIIINLDGFDQKIRHTYTE